MKVKDNNSAEIQTRAQQRAQNKAKRLAKEEDPSDHKNEASDSDISSPERPSKKQKVEPEPVKRGPGRPRKHKRGEPKDSQNQKKQKAKRGKKEEAEEDSAKESEKEEMEVEPAEPETAQPADKSPMSYASDLTRNNLDFLVTASEQVEKVSLDQAQSTTNGEKDKGIQETEEEMDIVERLKKIQDQVIAKYPIKVIDFSKSRERIPENAVIQNPPPRFVDCTGENMATEGQMKEGRKFYREVLDPNDPARGTGEPYQITQRRPAEETVNSTPRPVSLDQVRFERSSEARQYASLTESEKIAYHNEIARERAKAEQQLVTKFTNKSIMEKELSEEEMQAQYSRYLANLKKFNSDTTKSSEKIQMKYLTFSEFKNLRQKEVLPFGKPPTTVKYDTRLKNTYEENLRYSLDHVDIVSPDNYTLKKHKYTIRNDSSRVVDTIRSRERASEIRNEGKAVAEVPKVVAREVTVVPTEPSFNVARRASNISLANNFDNRRKGSLTFIEVNRPQDHPPNRVQAQRSVNSPIPNQHQITNRSPHQVVANRSPHQQIVSHQVHPMKSQPPVQYATAPTKQGSIIEFIDMTSDEDAGNRKVPHSFVDWKLEILRFYSDPISLLTQAHKLNLKTLKEGSYSFGADRKCRERVIQSPLGSPRCPSLLGTINSQGEDAPKTLTLTYGKQSGTYSLRPGLLIDVDRNIKLEVDENQMLNLYDLTREFYTNLQKPHPDLFYPYNFGLVFTGEMIAPNQLLVNFFGQDVVFTVHNFGSSLQVYYTDVVTTEQRVFPVRSVVLKPYGKKYILNFNFSFPCPLYRRGGVNGVKHAIRAGLNPLYF
ncbi:hypothetical protein HK103_002448 [Boothiomyces macroporosus]|uniref:Uncharacterized protein n=1 Tax=Boothiomyces macroporosus TaxID=261099 RepID=A0AAD5Y4R9_9FUNG|nr:hypothetical protein HK103_002448 [Boothiomyces macroporosus]